MEPTTPEKKLELLQCQRDQVIPLIKDLDRQIDYYVSQRDEARKKLQEIDEEIRAINKQLKSRGNPGKPGPAKPRRRSRNHPPRLAHAGGDDNESASESVDDSAPSAAAPVTPDNCRYVFKVPVDDDFLEVYICDGDDPKDVIYKFAKKHELSNDLRDKILETALNTIKASADAAPAPSENPAPDAEKKPRRDQRKKKGNKPSEQPKQADTQKGDKPAEQRKPQKKEGQKPRQNKQEQKTQQQQQQHQQQQQQPSAKLHIIRPGDAAAIDSENSAPAPEEPKEASATSELSETPVTEEKAADAEATKPEEVKPKSAETTPVEESKPSSESAPEESTASK